MVDGEVRIINNTATNTSGGGMSLYQSELKTKGYFIVMNNRAWKGGGIHTTSSTIIVTTVNYISGTLGFVNNRADAGGGLHLEGNSKLYLLYRVDYRDISSKIMVFFTSNQAKYGGAMYIEDDTNSGACSPDNECFIQALTLDPNPPDYVKSSLLPEHIDSVLNIATEKGPDIFGGLLDRCIPSPFAEVYVIDTTYYSAITYLGNISNITPASISSLPVRICFCVHEDKPDCKHQPSTFKVKKGEAFNVSLVAVDNVNHSVSANIISSLLSPEGGFSEGQQIQSVKSNCANLTFNVFSPHEFETIRLFADGPCGSSTPSTRYIDIQFLDCTCPVGFEPSNNSTRCECACDSRLSPYITDCVLLKNSLFRVNTNSWITYINDTSTPGFVIYPNCPSDYCRLSTENVSINLNLPNGADMQCANNRMGILCGACQEHLSLSLGSSRCLSCQYYWPGVLVITAIIARILLVFVLLSLNITITTGLINSFIFYANILGASNTLFLPSSTPSFPTIFVAWLNLDIGIDVCFFDGFDAYTKTWFQLSFSVYIIFLVIIIIAISENFPRFARVIGKRDPVATLATLVLLSYTKLLSATITTLSYGVLDYPDGSQQIVWLPDGNVKYLQGKHIGLFIMALLIILVGVPYTILLFVSQWLFRLPELKIFTWIKNTKLNAFIATYHVPYNSKYRYWTGLLLLVRIVLYVTSSFTISTNPQISLLVVIILVGGLFLIKEIVGSKVYKNSFVNLVETGIYFNLLTLSAFSLVYQIKADIKMQAAVSYISTIITFVLLIGAIVYHTYLLIRKKRPPQETNAYDYSLVHSQPASTKAEVTYSIIELPSPDDQNPPPEAKAENINEKEDHL